MTRRSACGRVRPKTGGGQWMLVDKLAELDAWLANEAEPGNVYEIRLEEMTEAEIEKLGEFDGW